MRRMTGLVLTVIHVVVLADASWAQPSLPNRAGVALGHLHHHVRDLEASKRFWIALGAKLHGVAGTTEVLQLPEVLIFLSRAVMLP